MERPLSEQGRADASSVGQWLAQVGWVPDHAQVSPAARAQETARRILVASGSAAPVVTVPALYTGRSPDYLDLLHEAAGACTLIVGHNPCVEEVVEVRTGQMVRMAPGSVACWEGDRLVHLQDPGTVRQAA